MVGTPLPPLKFAKIFNLKELPSKYSKQRSYRRLSFACLAISIFFYLGSIRIRELRINSRQIFGFTGVKVKIQITMELADLLSRGRI